MANDVFANGREISCKAADGKTICAFPDVCFTTPQTPATPPGVPIPYPNTGMASDTTSGSKKVKISNKEVMLKNKSYFKKSTGDEAGSAPKKGVITSTNRGKVYFNAWSMDVKFEGQNVVRHLDLTTHNHASQTGQTPPWPFMDSMAHSSDDPCAKEKEKEQEACKGYKPDGDKDPCPPGRKRYRSDANKATVYAEKIRQNPCAKARRCKLQPFNKTKKGKGGCCPGQTGHHLIPKASFKGVSSYSKRTAPCICVEGAGHSIGTHGMMHRCQSYSALKMINPTLRKVTNAAAGVVKVVFPESGCDPKCIKAQLQQYHEKDAKIPPDTEIKPPTTSKPGVDRVRETIAKAKDNLSRD